MRVYKCSDKIVAQLRGFTLVELIMVIVIVGVLAVAALPRFWDRQVFDSRGFYDETLSALRYAQKTAIAQRRNVCAAFTANTVTFTIASKPGGAEACNTDLASPSGTTPPFTITGTGVTFTPTPTSLQFDALGRPTPNTSQTFQVSGLPLDIIIEAETGYVHP